jgi:hypothetical protein
VKLHDALSVALIHKGRCSRVHSSRRGERVAFPSSLTNCHRSSSTIRCASQLLGIMRDGKLPSRSNAGGPADQVQRQALACHGRGSRLIWFPSYVPTKTACRVLAEGPGHSARKLSEWCAPLTRLRTHTEQQQRTWCGLRAAVQIRTGRPVCDGVEFALAWND